MEPTAYKFIHFIGLIIFFTGIGASLVSDTKKPTSFRFPAIAPGVGFLLILINGVGIWHKLGIKIGSWMIIELLILFALGASLPLIKNCVLPVFAIWFLAIVSGLKATHLGYTNSVILRE